MKHYKMKSNDKFTEDERSWGLRLNPKDLAVVERVLLVRLATCVPKIQIVVTAEACSDEHMSACRSMAHAQATAVVGHCRL